MKLTILVGEVGGARFLLGAREYLRQHGDGPGEDSLTAIVNVGDDVWMHGLRICPDLDTCMYTLGGVVDEERGWGHRNETWHAGEELKAYEAEPTWFGLGDRDIATHLIRSQMLRAGYPLSAITEALGKRWDLGVQLLPASDDRSETHVVMTDPDTGDQRAAHFQEWWVRYRAEVPTSGFVNVGAEQAKPGPGVLEAIADADVIALAPSNPVVSIGAILAIPGIRGAIRTAGTPVIGVSPIVEGAVVRGMADKALTVLGLETSAQAVAEYYGARSGSGLLDGWIAAPDDAVAVDGIAVRNAPIMMTDPPTTARIVHEAVELAAALR